MTADGWWHRIPRSRAFALAAAILLLHATSTGAQACVTGSNPGLDPGSGATYLFAGVVEKVHYFPRRSVRVRVTRVWKGPVRSHFDIRPGGPFMWTSCDSSFQPGESVLVSAEPFVHGLIAHKLSVSEQAYSDLHPEGTPVEAGQSDGLRALGAGQVAVAGLVFLLVLRLTLGRGRKTAGRSRDGKRMLRQAGFLAGGAYGAVRILLAAIDYIQSFPPDPAEFVGILIQLPQPLILGIGFGGLIGTAIARLLDSLVGLDHEESDLPLRWWLALGGVTGFLAAWWWDSNLFFGIETFAGVLCGAIGGWVGQRMVVQRIRRGSVMARKS